MLVLKQKNEREEEEAEPTKKVKEKIRTTEKRIIIQN
jgi:Zn-dependent peptidase ImmA (M78 family)